MPQHVLLLATPMDVVLVQTASLREEIATVMNRVTCTMIVVVTSTPFNVMTVSYILHTKSWLICMIMYTLNLTRH